MMQLSDQFQDTTLELQKNRTFNSRDAVERVSLGTIQVIKGKIGEHHYW